MRECDVRVNISVKARIGRDRPVRIGATPKDDSSLVLAPG
jgi:hypothetical protein